MSDDDYGITGSVWDRRHQKKIANLPFVLRQIDEAKRHPKPSVRPDKPEALTGEDLVTLERLLCRLRPTESRPFPDGWPTMIERVVRLTSYLQR